jgi:predicted DNA-binding protein YlxM (UPF0122 family)
MKIKKLTVHKIEQICRGYKGGIAVKRLAKKYNVSRQTILDHLHKNNVNVYPKKNFYLTKTQVTKLCLDYKNNIPTKTLSKKYKLTSTTIRNYLHRNNMKVIDSGHTLKNNQKENYLLIKKMYLNKDMDIVKIASKLKVFPSSIHRFLKRNRIPIKDASISRRTYSLNRNYFDKINTEGKAYFLGLLYADGCLRKNSFTFQIVLQERDKHILNSFKKELEFNGKLKFVNRKKEYKNNQNQYLLVISSKKIYKSLLGLGLYPNKSLTLKFPDNKIMPDRFLNHFVRGYFDGDGSASILPNNQKYISIIGTNQFLLKLKSIIENKKLVRNKTKLIPSPSKNMSYYKVGGNKQIKPLINWLYKDATFFLKRKSKILI